MTSIALLGAWTIAYFFGELFICGSTPNVLWGPYAGVLAKCAGGDGRALWIDESFAISDFLLDLMVFVLPHPKVSGPLGF